MEPIAVVLINSPSQEANHWPTNAKWTACIAVPGFRAECRDLDPAVAVGSCVEDMSVIANLYGDPNREDRDGMPNLSDLVLPRNLNGIPTEVLGSMALEGKLPNYVVVDLRILDN